MHIEPALSGSETLAKPFLFAAVAKEIEREDALMIRGALKHFRMTQGANCVTRACAPVLLHAGAREVVILRMALVVPGAVDHVRDVVDFMIAYRPEELRFRAVPQIVG
jgi:hypothetical protein